MGFVGRLRGVRAFGCARLWVVIAWWTGTVSARVVA